MINLLPPKLKKEYDSYLTERFVIFFGSAALLILILFNVILGVTFVFLKIQSLALAQQAQALEESAQNKEFLALDKSITDLVQKYRTVASVDDKIFRSLPVMEEIINIAPANIHLFSLSLERSEKQITLSGFAPQRQDVIVFKDALDNSKFFEKVVSPLSNLVKETDILFNFTLVLK